MGKSPYRHPALKYAQSTELILRFVPREYYMGKTQLEHSFFRQLYSQYPDYDFWANWELGFPIKSLSFFRGADGRAYIERGWEQFHSSIVVAQKQAAQLAEEQQDVQAVEYRGDLDTSSLDNLFASCDNSGVGDTSTNAPDDSQPTTPAQPAAPFRYASNRGGLIGKLRR